MRSESAPGLGCFHSAGVLPHVKSSLGPRWLSPPTPCEAPPHPLSEPLVPLLSLLGGIPQLCAPEDYPTTWEPWPMLCLRGCCCSAGAAPSETGTAKGEGLSPGMAGSPWGGDLVLSTSKVRVQPRCSCRPLGKLSQLRLPHEGCPPQLPYLQPAHSSGWPQE